MKIFLLYAVENWITDELAKEWIENNKELHTNNIHEADVIWVLSDYIIHKLPIDIYRQKKVITTIHHIVPWKVNEGTKRHFKILDEISDIFITNQDICAESLKQYVKKPIKVVPLWHNENIWKILNNKRELREKYGLGDSDFLVGSFQKDTEGASVMNKTYQPKLEKGPDIFVKAVKLLKEKKYPNLKVVLTGYYRHYIINELKSNNIDYYYFERSDFKKLNELFNCLDLYVVGSRVEGGPRSINECSLTKTPILSTKVGIAELLCHPDSIYDIDNIESILNCKTDVEYNYTEAQKYTISNYIKKYTEEVFN